MICWIICHDRQPESELRKPDRRGGLIDPEEIVPEDSALSQ
jgi:hypothetical protein